MRWTEVRDSEICKGVDSTRAAKLLVKHGILRADLAGKSLISTRLPIGKKRVYALTAKLWQFGEQGDDFSGETGVTGGTKAVNDLPV